MNVVLFGASGMVGQGVLRECLLADDVREVVSIVRAPTGTKDPKLRELVHRDFTDFSALAEDFAGKDACFFCLGISSAGMKEADYRHVTYDFTMAAARVFAEKSPSITFVYVSGAGTDSTEKGRSMWARVKGRTENDVMALFPNGYAFRPALIQPMHGVKSRTTLYRVAYVILAPFLFFWRAVLPGYVTTTEKVGKAMLRIAREHPKNRVIENSDINLLAAPPQLAP